MSLLDDIRKEQEELKKQQMETPHPKEDTMIETVVDLLEKRIRNKQYRFNGAYDIDEYYIDAFLAKLTYRNGLSGYELLDTTYDWQEGKYTLSNRPDVFSVETHPFDRFDYEYVTEKLPAEVENKIGAVCGCRCVEQYKVRKRLFQKFNDIIYLNKHGLTVGIRWRF